MHLELGFKVDERAEGRGGRDMVGLTESGRDGYAAYGEF